MTKPKKYAASGWLSLKLNIGIHMGIKYADALDYISIDFLKDLTIEEIISVIYYYVNVCEETKIR